MRSHAGKKERERETRGKKQKTNISKQLLFFIYLSKCNNAISALLVCDVLLQPGQQGVKAFWASFF